MSFPIDLPINERLHWHRFDADLTDEHIRQALVSIGIEPVHINREPHTVVFVREGYDRDKEIRRVLERWSFWQGEPME